MTHIEVRIKTNQLCKCTKPHFEKKAVVLALMWLANYVNCTLTMLNLEHKNGFLIRNKPWKATCSIQIQKPLSMWLELAWGNWALFDTICGPSLRFPNRTKKRGAMIFMWLLEMLWHPVKMEANEKKELVFPLCFSVKYIFCSNNLDWSHSLPQKPSGKKLGSALGCHNVIR